jgi:hypothetical protein
MGMTSKKFKKLKRNPKAFFRDLRFVKKIAKFFGFNGGDVGILREDITYTPCINPRQKKSEPKLIGSFVEFDDKVTLSLLTKRIKKDKNLTSLIFVQDTGGYLCHNKQANYFIKDKGFIGFKDGYSYFIYDKTSALNEEGFSGLFNIEVFRTNPFQGFRNVFVFNPNKELYIAIKYTNPFIRLVCIFQEDFEGLESFVDSYSDSIDVCIFHDSLSVFEEINFRRSIKYTDDNSLEKVIKSAIIDNSSKNDNLLLPIFGVQSVVENIDEYNSSEADVLVKLKRQIKSFDSFNVLLEMMVDELETLLVKEEVYYRYKTLLDNNKFREFFKYSTSDGVRYEFL